LGTSFRVIEAHRNELPSGKRPFEALEPVIRAIESLDPNDNTPRYFRSAHPTRSEGKEKSEQDTWLELIAGIDYSAKLLIGYCLAQASSVALDKSADWVKLAEEAGRKLGEMEDFQRLAQNFMDTIDLENGAVETEALQKLDAYEQKLLTSGDSDTAFLLPGATVAPVPVAESELGCTPRSRGAAQARHRHRRDQRQQIHGAQSQAAVSDLAHVPGESRPAVGLERLLYCPHPSLPDPLRVSGAGP